VEIIPSFTELRSKSRLTVPEGPPDKPLASTKFTEPTVGKQPPEIKGGLAALKAKGLKITNY
jgi:hypothetical protein